MVRLTPEERRAAFAGRLRVLRRPSRPEGDAEEAIVLSRSMGGRQILDRRTGATVEIPRLPRLWVTLGGWHLKDGGWEAEVTIHDRRERNRLLARGGIGGFPRPAGLRTRWAETVDAEGHARPRRVPGRGERRERWTPETERGYGGSGGRGLDERRSDGMQIPATAVDDADLAAFAARVADRDAEARGRLRDATSAWEGLRSLRRAEARGMTRAAAAIRAGLGECLRREG